MTNKELLYIEDALGHEEFLKANSCQASQNLQDPELSNYMKQLEKTHTEIYNRFFKLLQN